MKTILTFAVVVLLVAVTGTLSSMEFMTPYAGENERDEAGERDLVSENLITRGKANREKGGSLKKNERTVYGSEIPDLPVFCADERISVVGCNGVSSIVSSQGNSYPVMEINGQCWLGGFSREAIQGVRSWPSNHRNDPSVRIYDTDAFQKNERSLNLSACPQGWKIPSECEFNIFHQSIVKDWKAAKFVGGFIAYQTDDMPMHGSRSSDGHVSIGLNELHKIIYYSGDKEKINVARYIRDINSKSLLKGNPMKSPFSSVICLRVD